MTPTIPIEKATDSLTDFIAKLSPGEEVVLTRAGEPIAVIRAAPINTRKPRRLGALKGTILKIAPDFDALPEEFEDYLP